MNAKQYLENIKKSEASKEQTNVDAWNAEYEQLKAVAEENGTSANKIYFDKQVQHALCPYLRFVRFDALDPKDYPNGIARNSVYLQFEIDYDTKKVSLFDCGLVYLSPKDKQTEPHKYFVMKTIETVLTDKGGKKFRKQGFKDAANLFAKMEGYYKEVMKAVTEYTGGYPYKQGIEE